MGTPRKPRAYKDDPPELAKLNALTDAKEEIAEMILGWLHGDPAATPPVPPQSLTEARGNILLNLQIELSSDSQLSRWRTRYFRQQGLSQANRIAEEIAAAFADGKLAATPEQVREFQLRMLTVSADRSQNPALMLALARELRAGMEGKTKADLESKKLSLAERRVKVAEKKMRAASDELSKLRDPKSAADPAERQAILDEVDRIMGLKK